MKFRPRLVVLGADPLALADSPRPVADFGDLEPGPAELPVVHATLHSYSLPDGSYHPAVTVKPARRMNCASIMRREGGLADEDPDERREALVERERALLERFIRFL